MSEHRTDWLTGRSVIVAENRSLRPNEFASGAVSARGGPAVAHLALAEVGLTDAPGVPSCPFCIGSEARTPPAVYEQVDAAGFWQVRVVPNKFPAVTEDPGVAGERPAPPALGAQEVIIESARHIDSIAALSTQELQLVIEAYAHRLRHWRDDGRFRYGLVFKNQGPRAGASIAHVHSQFIALPDMPPNVAAEIGRAETYHRKNDACPYCRLIEDERSLGERIVVDRGGFVAFCPFASLQPHEVWVLPERHQPSFEELSSSNVLRRLAEVLHFVLEGLEQNVPDAAYNMLLRTAAWGGHCDNWCHWRIEFIPRANPLAGFELATGVHINPLAPERAARQLRSP